MADGGFTYTELRDMPLSEFFQVRAKVAAICREQEAQAKRRKA